MLSESLKGSYIIPSSKPGRIKGIKGDEQSFEPLSTTFRHDGGHFDTQSVARMYVHSVGSCYGEHGAQQ